MRAGNRGLAVASAALVFFSFASAPPSYSMVDKPWYSGVFSGVRAVHLDGKSGTEAPREADKQAEQPYVSRIIKQDNTITLKGQVPSDGDLKLLTGIVAATSPGATFVDKTKPNANVPDRDTWLAAMTFALRQLAKLENGSAILRDTVITIDGVTRAEDDFSTIQKKLREEVPKGLVLQVGLRPAAVRPFIWFAQIQPGYVSLSGYVPNEMDQVLLSYVQTQFQNAKIDNAMAFAVGAPEEWLAAAKLSLDMLALLQTGSATLSDRVIKVDGIYASSEMAELFKLYRQKLPKGFRLEASVTPPVSRATPARVEDVMAVHAAPAALNP